MFTHRSFPRAILHVDGDSFFASIEQARHPDWKGKPVITGKERNIASSMSYEAKARGVKRAMPMHEIRRLCPDAIIVPSDYETYSLLSHQFYDVVRRYTGEVEEYSIDECFGDLTGMRGPLRMSYPDMALKIRDELKTTFGFTFSVGLGPNKTIAKLASNWKKPYGCTIIPAREIHEYLKGLPVGEIWGIGPQTTQHLARLRIRTALEFATKDEAWVTKHFHKPTIETWRELRGECVMQLELEPRVPDSVQKFKTFTPPSADPEFIFAQLCKNIENACIKARRHNRAAERAHILLRTQNFHHTSAEISFSHPTAFPDEIIKAVKPLFRQILKKGELYRGTCITLFKMTSLTVRQMDLFGVTAKIERQTRLYGAVDAMQEKFGKHTLYLGASYAAHMLGAHAGSRGESSERSRVKLKGEFGRKRLGIPMFLGKII